MRHTVICRISDAEGADPKAYTTITCTHGEDGWSWGAASQGIGFLIEAHVKALVATVSSTATADLPNITITERSADEVRAAPPLETHYLGLVMEEQPTANVSILMPIRIERPERTKFEHWAVVHRPDHAKPGCSGLPGTRYVRSMLGQEILRCFNAADEKRDHTLPKYEGWGQKHYSSIAEIWVRPSWEMVNPEFMHPEDFPLLFVDKPLPPRRALTAEQEEGEERRRKMRFHKAQFAKQMGQQGRKWDARRQSWR